MPRQENMVTAQVTGLDETIAHLSVQYPKLADRARRSALSSTGYMIRTELRNHVEYGGTGWPKLHPLSAQRKKDKSGDWRKASKRSPLEWLGKFARYKMDKDGERVAIDFGKSRKGQAGQFDKFLSAVALKHERGARIGVTPAMRRKMAMTRNRRPKLQEPGKTYFPLRASTRTLIIPRRQSIGPVFRKVRPRVPAYMRDKFWAAFNRYQAGLR